MTEPRSQTQTASQSENARYAVSGAEGLQLHANRNLFQLTALIVVASIGAVIGWSMTDDRPDLAALVGGILGMIVGTFLSGFVLMLIPPPAVSVTLTDFARKYRAMKRRWVVSSVGYAAGLLGLPFMISCFRYDGSDVAWCIGLAWIVATFGLCAYRRMLGYRIRELRCPACSERFGRIGSPCSHCGLMPFDVGNETSEPSVGPEPRSGLGKWMR
jgi:hypothetical protein